MYNAWHCWFHWNLKLLSGVKKIQLRWEEYREFSSSDVQLVFAVYPNPIDALLSFQHFWTEMTALLATSFLVSM